MDDFKDNLQTLLDKTIITQGGYALSNYDDIITEEMLISEGKTRLNAMSNVDLIQLLIECE